MRAARSDANSMRQERTVARRSGQNFLTQATGSRYASICSRDWSSITHDWFLSGQ